MIPNEQKVAMLDELEKVAVSRWRTMAQKGWTTAQDAFKRSGIPDAWRNVRQKIQKNIPKGPQTGAAGKVNTAMRDFQKENIDRLKEVKDVLAQTIE